MATAVKITISLLPERPKEAEEIAREKGQPLSAVIQDALRLVKKNELNKEFREMQGFWSSKTKKQGILTEKDLQKYLKK